MTSSPIWKTDSPLYKLFHPTHLWKRILNREASYNGAFKRMHGRFPFLFDVYIDNQILILYN